MLVKANREGERETSPTSLNMKLIPVKILIYPRGRFFSLIVVKVDID